MVDEVEKILAFATEFLNDLPGYWRRSAMANKKKLQSFLYPNGVIYTKDGGYRTGDDPLLEQVKEQLRDPEFSLVGHGAETSEQESGDARLALYAWLSRLYNVFVSDGEESEALRY